MIIKESELQTPPQWQSRMEFPRILNDLGLIDRGVEIGVQRGIFSAHIRSIWAGLVLHCVDPWKPYYGVQDTADQHESYRLDAIAHLDAACLNNGRGSYIIHRTTALDFAAEMAEHKEPVFDFIYLDGDHDEEPLRKEIEVFWPLIKPGGILAGHDYQPNGWIQNGYPNVAYDTQAEITEGGPFYVKKVVDETFPANMISLTSQETDGGWRSWCVRRST